MCTYVYIYIFIYIKLRCAINHLLNILYHFEDPRLQQEQHPGTPGTMYPHQRVTHESHQLFVDKPFRHEGHPLTRRESLLSLSNAPHHIMKVKP